MKKSGIMAGIVLIILLSLTMTSCEKKQGTAGQTPGAQTGAQSGTSQSVGAAQQGKLDINTASAQELQNIPGIDQTLAQNIVSYRDANGPFSSVDDLSKVQGMDIQKLDSVRSYLTVSQPPSGSGSMGGATGGTGPSDMGSGGTGGTGTDTSSGSGSGGMNGTDTSSGAGGTSGGSSGGMDTGSGSGSSGF